jgi:hypothetical protein
MFEFFISFIIFLIFLFVLFSVIYHLLTNYFHWKYQTIYSNNNPDYSNNLTPGCLSGCNDKGECPNGNFCYNSNCCKYDFQCNTCKRQKHIPPVSNQNSDPSTPPPITGNNLGIRARISTRSRLNEGHPVIGPRLNARQLGKVEINRERQRAADDKFFEKEWADERAEDGVDNTMR